MFLSPLGGALSQRRPLMFPEEIYSRFIAWLDRAWWRLPASEHLLPSIRAFFTAEEAGLLTGLPFVPTRLEELAGLRSMRPADLAERLDALARKGAVWRAEKEGGIFYHLNDAFFLFFRGPLSAPDPDPSARAMAPPLNRYFHDGLMDQLAPARAKPLRTVPIHRTVEDPRGILPYEDALAILDSQDLLVVSRCACRQRKRLDPGSSPCAHPEEVCLHFGSLARYLVENGMARKISGKEARDILKAAADAGLVHAVSNRQQDVDTLCNCCRCSCVFFESYHVLKHPKSHDFSNYRLKVNRETCRACGLCAERCPVEALGLEDDPSAGMERKTADLA